jgi:tRNA modification GTPase
MFDLDKINVNNPTYLTNAREISILKNSLESIRAIEKGIENNIPIDMLEIDLKNVWNLLGEITGETYDEELLDKLFSNFCVGK